MRHREWSRKPNRTLFYHFVHEFPCFFHSSPVGRGLFRGSHRVLNGVDYSQNAPFPGIRGARSHTPATECGCHFLLTVKEGKAFRARKMTSSFIIIERASSHWLGLKPHNRLLNSLCDNVLHKKPVLNVGYYSDTLFSLIVGYCSGLGRSHSDFRGTLLGYKKKKRFLSLQLLKTSFTNISQTYTSTKRDFF